MEKIILSKGLQKNQNTLKLKRELRLKIAHPSIKTTGKANMLKLLVRTKKDNNYVLVDDDDDFSSVIERKDQKITNEEESSVVITSDELIDEPLIKFYSYNLILISRQKRIGYIRGHPASPLKTLRLFSYDSFPIFLNADECIFKVELSTVSYIDCAIRMNKFSPGGSNLDYPDAVPGFCAVGTIVAIAKDQTFSENKLSVGDRIATILVGGGNSRYATQSLSRVVKISEKDNSKYACALMSSYFAAFACLHHSTSHLIDRYKRDRFKDKTIYVNGGMSIVGQAIIHLAKCLGAETVYSTGKAKDFHHLKKIGGTPLYIGTYNSNQTLEKRMDLVIDCSSYDALEYLLSVKKPEAPVILYRYGDIAKSGRHGVRNDLQNLILKIKCLQDWNASICDPIQEIFLNKFEMFKRDFKFLQSLTTNESNGKRLRPRIVASIGLDEVPYTHLKLEMNNVKGVITVDPWE